MSKRLVQKLTPSEGYIFASGHNINPAVKLRKILEKFSKYPINLNRME